MVLKPAGVPVSPSIPCVHVLAEYCLSNHNIENTTACGTGVWGEGEEGGEVGGGEEWSFRFDQGEQLSHTLFLVHY